MRICKLLVPLATVPIGLALLGCSSVKAEKGPFNDNGWIDEGEDPGGTGSATSGGTGGTGGGTGGAGNAGAGGMGKGGPPGCQTFDYANYQAPAAAVSLKTDILPIFVGGSCTLTGCHSDKSAQVPKLGPANGMADAAGLQAIRNALVGNSEQVPVLKIVSPGKPDESYLMNKIDGTVSCMGFDCKTAEDCGVRMPPLPQPLEAAKINKIRDWIKQGAPAM